MDFGNIERFRNGSRGPARIEEEFRRFGFLVYRIAFGILKNREDAEDLVLEVFADKAGAFLESHPGIPAAELGYWLHRVAKNLALDRLRARKRANASFAADGIADSAPAESTDAEARCDRLLTALEGTDREILRGKYGEGLAWEEIGRRTGLSLAQARYRAQKALAKLRRMATKETGYALE